MLATDLQLGQLVSSRAGRDAGKMYLVVRIDDERFVGVADGEKRTVEEPKRKNIKHLTVHKHVSHSIQARLESGGLPANSEIRKELRAFTALVGEGEKEKGLPNQQGG